MFGKLIMAGGLVALSLSAATQEQTPLKTAAQVHHLSTAAAGQHIPVLLRGVVTQFIPEWNGLSLQDRTDAVYVMGANIHDMHLQLGQTVEIVGTSGPGAYAPLVNATQVKVLGWGRLPKPLAADWKSISSGACDNTYVAIMGVVRSVLPVGPPRWRWAATAIHVDLGGNVLWAYVRDGTGLSVDQLPDAKVRITGTCIVLANSRKRFEQSAILVSDAKREVQVLEPAASAPERLPITPIDRLFVYRPGTELRRRVRISGTVVWVDENRVFLEDGNAAVLVRTTAPAHAAPGDEIDAIGFPTAGGYAAEMEDAILRSRGKRSAVVPVDVRANDLAARFHDLRPYLPDSMLIRTRATVLGVSDSASGELFTLQDGPTVFVARLLHAKTSGSGPKIAEGARVSVTGVFVIQPDDLGLPQSFELLMRSAGDLQVLEKPSWLTRSLALRTAGILLTVAVLAIFVVVLLGRQIGAQSTMIEEQKKREQEMGERVRQLVENANDLVYILDTDGRIMHVNYGAERLTGYSRREQLNLNMTDLLAPEERELFRRKLESGPALEGSKFEQSEWSFVRKDRGTLAVELSQRFVADKDGRVRIEMIGRDVTARQQAMFDYEERFRTLADNIAQLAWMAEESGYIVWFNERWFQYTGATLAESRGWGWQKWHHPDHIDRVSERMRQCFETGEVWQDTFLLRGRDGHFRWFLGTAMPIRDQNGKVARWFGTNTDIAAQKHTEMELQRSNDDLRQFAYIASHDLQEPLRNICIYTELLARTFANGDLTPDRATYMDTVSGGAKRMQMLISDLLTYSQATSTEIQRLPAVSIASAVQAAIENLRTVIGDSQAIIKCCEMPVLCASPVHMTQLLQNLVSNAIKYRRQDVVPLISIRAEKRVDFWIFSIADNGCGFDPEYAERIFGIFKRLHGREIPGTGIGLAICRAIVERHGGKIWAEGRPGQGATFWFTLPAQDDTTTTQDPFCLWTPGSVGAHKYRMLDGANCWVARIPVVNDFAASVDDVIRATSRPDSVRRATSP